MEQMLSGTKVERQLTTRGLSITASLMLFDLKNYAIF